MIYLIIRYLSYSIAMSQYLSADYLVLFVSLEMPFRVAEYCYLLGVRAADHRGAVVLE